MSSWKWLRRQKVIGFGFKALIVAEERGWSARIDYNGFLRTVFVKNFAWFMVESKATMGHWSGVHGFGDEDSYRLSNGSREVFRFPRLSFFQWWRLILSLDNATTLDDVTTATERERSRRRRIVVYILSVCWET